MTKPHRGINRIIVAVHDLDAAMSFYGTLLGAEFARGHGVEAATFGVEVAFSWDAGVEIVAPLAGRESAVAKHLAEHGEGIAGVVFAVADADASLAAAESLGLTSYHSLDYSAAEIEEKLGGRFGTYKEHFLAATPPLSGTVLIGEFTDAPPAASVDGE